MKRFVLAAFFVVLATSALAATALQWGVDRTTTPWTTCMYDANNVCQGAFTLPATGGGVLLPANRGGTGVNNGASTITLGGNFSTSGAFPLVATLTGATNVTFPTSGTLATTAAANVASVSNSDGTLTISPTTGAVVASIALGHANTWSGQQTFVAPILGTPASVNLTNGTSLPAPSINVGALANGMTATTQSGSDSSTKIATTAQVQAALTVGPSGGLYPNPVYFGSGRPWVDVRSGANGCAAAVGAGGVDDQPAIQCQINFMYNNFGAGGGVVYFGPGTYTVASTLTVKGNVILQGVGVNVSNIRILTDIVALAFDSTTDFATLDRIEVFGNTSSPTQNLVTVANGRIVLFKDCVLDGGKWALQTGGADGDMHNCKIRGWGAAGGGILSTGANTYYDAKIDNSPATTLAAFEQAVCFNGGRCENRIVHSDMSGNYTNSLFIADTNNLAVTTILSTVFSSPISITGAQATDLTSDEIGSTTLNAVGIINITGSTNLSGGALTVSGGTQNCAGNSAITCSTNPVSSITTTSPITGGGTGPTLTLACATCGVTGSPLSQFAATTSAQLAGIISDETGSGALVFANSPTLVTPVLGAATATTVNGVTIPSVTDTAALLGATQTFTGGDTFGGSSGTPLTTTTSNASNTFVVATTAAASTSNVPQLSLQAQTSTQLRGAATLKGSLTNTTDASRSGMMQITIPTAGTAFNAVQLNQGQLVTSGPAVGATPTSCGTGSPTASGNDVNGTATVGTAATSCTIAFANTWPSVPDCVVSSNSVVAFATAAPTTTQLVIGLSAALTGGKVSWHCQAHQ